MHIIRQKFVIGCRFAVLRSCHPKSIRIEGGSSCTTHSAVCLNVTGHL
ncbi:hypothetical protein X961_5750 [Burkholderia pseudomallei MSHR5613]|nr:hypothetical protein X961_5750 [Burkholderia pseudomallei MSHR5613]KGS72937.1 hypothetical protein X942_5937 [Burkholderia pseudomallei MSHR5596]